MTIARITRPLRLLVLSSFLCTGAICGTASAFAQEPAAAPQLARAGEPDAPAPKWPSAEQEHHPRSCASAAPSETPCSIRGFFHDTREEAWEFGRGLRAAPRGAIRPANLEWELPILATTGVLIAKVDRPADNRIQSASLQQTAREWSNAGLGLEIGSAALAYGIGCGKHHPYLRDTGFKALAAMGAAGAADLVLKLGFDRQFPYTPGSTGKFWGGGRSFPSGHSATSFAFAAVVAHRYPHNPWIKWGAYALATGVSLSRYPAKRHFPSDILVGATLGYVTGAYMARH